MSVKQRVLNVSIVISCLLVPAGSGFSLASQKRKARDVTAAHQAGDLYRSNCARCHGAEGRGDTPLGRTFNAPDFTDQKWWREHVAITSTRNLISIVTNGKGGMPAFSKKLNRAEIKMLAAYVRRFRSQTGMTSTQ